MSINPDITGGVIYTPHLGEDFVGYRVQHPDGRVGYVTLCPSHNDDPAMADVFVYNGPTGEPGMDDTEFFVIPYGTARHLDRACGACNAEVGEPCRPDCIGEAGFLESRITREDITAILRSVWDEIQTNAANSDAHTLEDVAADVVRRLQHDFLSQHTCNDVTPTSVDRCPGCASEKATR